MTNQLKFDIQTNGIKHTHIDPMPSINERFLMVKDIGIFDYVDKTPEVHEIEDFKLASQKYNIPIRAGGWFYTIGDFKDLLGKNLKTAKILGSTIHNVQIQSYDVEGRIVSDLDVRDAYLQAYDIGMKLDIVPCLEIHVNMWSEDFSRVTKVGKLVEDKDVEFNITLDHSHVIFKIDNLKEQKIFKIDKKIDRGQLIIDSFKKGNVVSEWINNGWVKHCHARSSIPNNPMNIFGKH